MLIKRTSPISGKPHELEIDITLEQIREWERGMLAQDAFPNLTPDEREFFMTGILPGEWDSMFGGEE